ncbi:MAG: phosphate signaling complex protein PhoU [Halanaerobiaceae bacterium]
MRRNFNNKLKNLKNEMLKMGSLVEETIYDSIEALKEQDLELAKQVIERDDQIDEYEVEIEEKCIQLIALQQPVARDLRTIIVISKVVTDLERIGDHASNIAHMVLEIGQAELIKPLIDVPRMTDIVNRRLRESLNAFLEFDVEKAQEIAQEDEKVDQLDEQILRELLTFMMNDPATINQAIFLIFISRFLERIGDHSTNICERVIYMATGERDEY